MVLRQSILPRVFATKVSLKPLGIVLILLFPTYSPCLISYPLRVYLLHGNLHALFGSRSCPLVCVVQHMAIIFHYFESSLENNTPTLVSFYEICVIRSPYIPFFWQRNSFGWPQLIHNECSIAVLATVGKQKPASCCSMWPLVSPASWFTHRRRVCFLFPLQNVDIPPHLFV